MECFPTNTQIHEHTVGNLSVSVSVSVSVKSPSLGKVPLSELVALME